MEQLRSAGARVGRVCRMRATSTAYIPMTMKDNLKDQKLQSNDDYSVQCKFREYFNENKAPLLVHDCHVRNLHMSKHNSVNFRDVSHSFVLG